MFLRGLLGYLPANIISGLVGVASIWVFTHLLTPEQYGTYALAFSVFTLVHVGLFSWAEAAMARFWPAQSTPRDLADLYSTLYRALGLASLALVPVCIALLVFEPLPAIMVWPVLLALVGIPLRSALIMAKEGFRARGDVRTAAAIDIWFVIGVFGLGVAAIMLGAGAAGPLIGFLVAPLLALPLVLSKDRAVMKNGRFNCDLLRRAIHYGYPISMSLGMAVVLNSTDRFMLAWFMDEAAVGAYHASYSLANRTLDILFVWLGMAGVPAMVMALEKDGHSALRAAAFQHGQTVILIALPAAVGVALVARPLADVLIGPELRQASASVTPLIAASGFLSGLLFYYFNQAFVLGKRTDRLLAVMAVPAVANIAFNVVLIPRLGIYGAALATLLSFAVAIIASVVGARGVIAMPLQTRALLSCGVCCVPMAAIVYVLPDWGGLLELITKSAAGAATYLGCAYAMNAAGLRDLLANLGHTLNLRQAPHG